MNCEKCGRVFLIGQEKCICGWKPPKVVVQFNKQLLTCAHPNCPDPGSMKPQGAEYYYCRRHYSEMMGWPYRPAPINPTDMKFKKRLEEVNAHVEEYQCQHPGATKKMACFDYMHNKGIHLPTYLAELEEQKKEREAIQKENA